MNQIDTNIAIFTGKLEGEPTYTTATDATLTVKTINPEASIFSLDGGQFIITEDDIDTHKVDYSKTLVDATDEDGHAIKVFLETTGRVVKIDGRTHKAHSFTRHPQFN